MDNKKEIKNDSKESDLIDKSSDGKLIKAVANPVVPAGKNKFPLLKNKTQEGDTVSKVKKKNIWVKDIFLGIINLAFLFGLVYLLGQIPQRAGQIKSLRSQSVLNTEADDMTVLKFDYENNIESIEKIKKAYPTDDGLIAFMGEIEKLKTEGSVVGFTFASDIPVPDKTKNFGFPIIIMLSGSWERISADIIKIQNLPYVFRPVTFDAEEIPEEGRVEVKYGGFLYVDKSLEKN
ncbi:hypothetical protein IPM62_06070 [Candidatus Woesebacteria bacterium]|nr:MAG: hypothetical protein IPM62_06070 [Candidatus Woesebacteria bacterium]